VKHNGEDYLLTIWELIESFGNVNEKGVSQRMGISLPSAWEGLHRLEDEGLISIGRTGISFSQKGYLQAFSVTRAHRITEYFAYSYLEVPWDEVHASVMNLEHDFSKEMLLTLYRKMGNPTYCPHGNPIYPSMKINEFEAFEAEEGRYHFSRQTLEDRDFLKKLFNAGSIPGKEVRLERAPDGIYISGENGEIKLTGSMVHAVRLKF